MSKINFASVKNEYKRIMFAKYCQIVERAERAAYIVAGEGKKEISIPLADISPLGKDFVRTELIRRGCKVSCPLIKVGQLGKLSYLCLLYTSPSPRDRTRSRMPSSA